MSTATATRRPSNSVRNPDDTTAINTRFQVLMPELHSRFTRLSMKYPKRMRQAVVDDAIGAAYLNFASATRRGKQLSASDLAYFGQYHIHFRSTITQRTWTPTCCSQRRSIMLIRPTPGH